MNNFLWSHIKNSRPLTSDDTFDDKYHNTSHHAEQVLIAEITKIPLSLPLRTDPGPLIIGEATLKMMMNYSPCYYCSWALVNFKNWFEETYWANLKIEIVAAAQYKGTQCRCSTNQLKPMSNAFTPSHTMGSLEFTFDKAKCPICSTPKYLKDCKQCWNSYGLRVLSTRLGISVAAFVLNDWTFLHNTLKQIYPPTFLYYNPFNQLQNVSRLDADNRAKNDIRFATGSNI